MDTLPASMKTARIPLYDVFMMYCIEILSFQTISLLISAQFDALRNSEHNQLNANSALLHALRHAKVHIPCVFHRLCSISGILMISFPPF